MSICAGTTATNFCVAACSAWWTGIALTGSRGGLFLTLARFLVNGFAVGEAAEAFDFISHGQEGFFPIQYNMLHRWRGRRKSVILGKIVQDGVVICQHGVLKFNLGGEQVREKGVDGGQQ